MLAIISFLVIAHSIQAYLFLEDLIEYVGFLDLDVERNLPTFYSSVAIEMCGLLLLFIYFYNRHIGNSYRWAWLGLSLIFIFLGIDEATKIHENFGDMVEPLVDAQGVLYFPWVLPYGIAVSILGAIYIPWLLHIPKKTCIRFIFSGIVFLSGAMGAEIISALYAEQYGTSSPQYTWTYTCLLYTSPSPRDRTRSRMPSSA